MVQALEYKTIHIENTIQYNNQHNYSRLKVATLYLKAIIGKDLVR